MKLSGVPPGLLLGEPIPNQFLNALKQWEREYIFMDARRFLVPAKPKPMLDLWENRVGTLKEYECPLKDC